MIDVLTKDERELLERARGHGIGPSISHGLAMIEIIDRLAAELAEARRDAVVCREFERIVRGVMKDIPLSLTINTDEYGGIGACFDGANGENYSWTPDMRSCVLNLEEQIAREKSDV